ncbi:S1C family serine protease [Symbioplanes lichenis]|uniref:S1C family serine protease n=1 Tax=Symbioplanes lichenis TaxID=1629072 RepID=UPI0027395ADF|nr:trypsin-like peptidase domain-containing protein [Actinoplanes lichenis]
MNEHETPQRHEDSSAEEQSHRPADASHAGSSPERGTSDTTAQQSALTPEQSAPPQAPPAPPAQPGQWQGSPWAQGGQPHYGQQWSGQQQWPGQQHYPGYAHGYAGQQPQYAIPAGGSDQTQQQWSGQPAPEGQQQWTGQPGAEGQQQWAGQQADAPIWATGVGTTEQRDPEKARRGRRILVTGAVAVLIALGAGGVGAATALAFDDNNGSSSVQTSNSAVTRVVDRSSLAQIVASVKDQVVSITTDSGEGSGVVLTSDGYIVTNNHVVSTAQGNTVNVIFADGKKVQATIVGTDERTDLAVVKATGVSDLKAATLGSSANMQVGDTVLALGSPLGLEGSVTEGIISAKDRTIQSSSEDDQQQTPQNPFGGGQQQQQQSASTTMSGLLQTDAPINPGNSGGALVNTNGEVIGINSAIYTSGQSTGNIGLGFAIPSDKVETVANALMKGEKVSHPALGVSVTEGEDGGALVSSVTANSAAAKAGLEQGDVIKTVNGKTINDSDDLVAIIQAAKVGDKVTIVFTRNGQQQTVSATLAEAS